MAPQVSGPERLSWADENLAAYVLMLARMDSLALGALLALLAREPSGLQRWQRAAWGVAAVSGALLGWIFVAKHGLWLHHRQIHTVGFSIIALFFAALLTVTAHDASLLHRLFTLRPMMMLGRYSYGLYVIHHPVAIGLGSLLGGWQLPTVLGSRLPALLVFSAACFAVSLLLAMVSWHLFESRFLNLKDRFAMRGAGAATCQARQAPVLGFPSGAVLAGRQRISPGGYGVLAFDRAAVVVSGVATLWVGFWPDCAHAKRRVARHFPGRPALRMRGRAAGGWQLRFDTSAQKHCFRGLSAVT